MENEGQISLITGEKLTNLVRDALFNYDTGREQKKVDQFLFCFVNRNDYQSILGWVSLKVFNLDFPEFKMFTLFTSENNLTETIERIKKNYGHLVDKLEFMALGDGFIIDPSLDDVMLMRTKERAVADKTITESVFEDYIMGNYEQTDDRQVVYKHISDLGLTIMNYKDKVVEEENKIDMELMLSKTFDTFLMIGLNTPTIQDRERWVDYINYELEKYVVTLGAPY